MKAHTSESDRSSAVESALRDGPGSYGLVSRLNHWVIALGMVGMLASGLALEYLPLAETTGDTIMGWHQAIGVTVLLYGAWRVGWRLYERFPRSTVAMPAWQERASKAVHVLLLAVIVAMPMSGLVMTLYAGYPVDVFGLVTIPAPASIDWLSGLAGAVHAYTSWLLLALLALHVGAVLKHHFIDRDGTLRRMLRGHDTSASDPPAVPPRAS